MKLLNNKNLNNESLKNHKLLLENCLSFLLDAECVYSEKVNMSGYPSQEQYRFCFYAGEELSESSYKKNFAAVGLQECEAQLKKLSRAGLLSLLLDDGWVHLSVEHSSFSERQRLTVESTEQFEAL